jgi:CRP-like cAMP-binding protein
VTAPTAGVKNRFAPGEPIFSVGDAPTCAYLIQSGKVEIRVGARARVIDTLESGEIFGEMALVDDHARSASAFAVELTTCTIITKQQFAKHMERSDPLTRAMLKLMTKRLRNIAHDAHKAAA